MLQNYQSSFKNEGIKKEMEIENVEGFKRKLQESRQKVNHLFASTLIWASPNVPQPGA
jgi:hypothetical protein